MLHYMEHRIMPLQNRPYVVRYRPSGTLFINKYDLTIVFRTERWSDKDESIGTLSRIAAIHHTLCFKRRLHSMKSLQYFKGKQD